MLPSRDLLSAKRKLREQMLLRRQQLPHAAMVAASDSLARHIADHPILAFGKCYGLYRAMRGEIDMSPSIAFLREYRKQTALPRMGNATEPLNFHTWQEGDALARHALGVEEPLIDTPIVSPDIIFCPLLAFDGDGFRLGYGGGYYDRTIDAMRMLPTPPLFIGVAYSIQEVERVPSGETDQPLDGILTEHGVSIFNHFHPQVRI
jgi:5-formyltetrahydrofolate cyclo-ligase